MSKRQIKLAGNTSLVVTVSEADYERVKIHKWYLNNGYPSAANIGKLHMFILPRTPDVPAKYVIDHANRDTLDVTRENLRFTSSSFNNWNTKIRSNATSKYKGVSWNRTLNKWRVTFRQQHIGLFEDERTAFFASAKAVLREWPEWASTSDLLVGPDLLSMADVEQIKLEVAHEVLRTPTKVRELPAGVTQTGSKFKATYAHKSLGVFMTVASAEAAVEAKKTDVENAKWKDHLARDITRDANNKAVIALTGKAGIGKFTIVPENLWHILTFEHSWHLAKGYASGTWEKKPQLLHTVIYRLLHPDFEGSYQNSIDHIITTQKLNNGVDNLRTATMGEQQRNKEKRANTTSQYVGVSARKGRDTWNGNVMINKKYYTVSAQTEIDCARKLDVIERNVLGAKARVRVPLI